MTQERTTQQASRQQLREFRRIVAAAVGALRSQEVRDTFVALSLEELADQHIERLSESGDPTRPSRLQRIRIIRDDLTNSIEAMKETPPENFRRHDPDTDVNTAPESS